MGQMGLVTPGVSQEIRYPTTAQLHAHSHDMVRLSRNYPFGAGTALALVEGASHEVRLLRVGYTFFTTAGPRPWRIFGKPGIDHYLHRCAALLVLALRDTPEPLLLDVLAAHWVTWPVIKS